MGVLSRLEPKGFFGWFERIAQVPRPSYHEGMIRDFLVEFAQSHGYDYMTDDMYNVFMRVPATKGYENDPPLLLQCHTDMVPMADDGVKFDFTTQPIQLEIRGNELHAKGTTLGMDDGGGMAMILAVADSADVKHPELELLFTTQEEVGMAGINAFDLSCIRSRRMLNLDCGRMNNLCISCAGFKKLVVEETMEKTASQGAFLQIELMDGLSGHAGLMIHKNRACMANILGEILCHLGMKMSVQLGGIQQLSPAIISRMTAQVCVPSDRKEEATECIDRVFSVIKKRYTISDSGITCSVVSHDNRADCFISVRDTERIAKLLFMLRTAAHKINADDPGIIEVSGHIESAELMAGTFRLNYGICAIYDDERDMYAEIEKQIIRLLGFGVEIGGAYPGWPPMSNSALRDAMDRVYRDIYGADPGHAYIHGCTEVGFICKRIPDMDAVGMNLPMANAHTTAELLYIDQVPAYWEFLTAVLENRA